MKSPESRESDGATPFRSWTCALGSPGFPHRARSAGCRCRGRFRRRAVALGAAHGSGVTVNSVRQISWPRNRSQTASTAWIWKSRLGSKWSFTDGLTGSGRFPIPRCRRIGGEVRLGYVVHKRAVAEHHSTVPPAGASSSYHSAIPSASGSTSSRAISFVKACDQRASTNGTEGLCRLYRLGFPWAHKGRARASAESSQRMSSSVSFSV